MKKLLLVIGVLAALTAAFWYLTRGYSKPELISSTSYNKLDFADSSTLVGYGEKLELIKTSLSDNSEKMILNMSSYGNTELSGRYITYKDADKCYGYDALSEKRVG
jgi:hypothetical protein